LKVAIAPGEVMNFATVYPSVIIAPDITLYKELKLRLLNGTHTLSCGIAFLSGFKTVLQAMEDERMSGFIRELMVDEIAPAIPFEIPGDEARVFALNVIDRFSNPSIAHQWISITLNYTAKMKMRVVPVLQNYFAIYKELPPRLTMGLAAWLAFMKVVKKEGKFITGNMMGSFTRSRMKKPPIFLISGRM
jgi:tagaturonate reductase